MTERLIKGCTIDAGCRDVPTTRVTAGCEHEHIRPHQLCTGHLAHCESQARHGRLVCLTCHEAGHIVPVTIIDVQSIDNCPA